MIFRKLLNNSIPKPILHYDFSEIADNKCPNKGSLGSDYDLQIESSSGTKSSIYKSYAMSFFSMSEDTSATLLEKTDDTYSIKVVDLTGSAWRYLGVSYNTPYSFGLHLSSNNSNLDIYFGYVLDGSAHSLVSLHQGWNIITLNSDSIPSGASTIFSISNSVANDIITFKQTPIFNNCFVTGNGVYGKCSGNFKLNINSGWSSIAVREPQLISTVSQIWSKDDEGMGCSFEGSGGITMALNSFGVQNDVNDIYEQSSISYSTSRNYNGHLLNKGTRDDDNTWLLRVGASINESGKTINRNSQQQELLIWNRDLTDSQLQEYISKNIIPIPEVYYDVDKQQALNTDDGKGYLIDYSGHGHHGELKNFTYSNPEWTQPNWRIINTNDSEQIPRVTAEELSTGVYHITELVREYSTGFLGERITNVAGKKFCINVLNKPANRELGVAFEGIAVTNLQEGNNIIDLSNSKHTGRDGWDYIWISGDPGTVDFYITIFPFFDESSANGWGYQQLPDLDSWVELNTSIISKNKVKLTGTNGNYDSLNYSILPIYHDNNIAVFSPFKARFKVETTRESGQIGFAADGHVQASGSQVVKGAYISYIDNGYVNVDFPGYIWDVSNLEMTTNPYLYCYPDLGNNAVIEQLPIQDYLTMNGDLNNQIDINSNDTYQTILVDMEVSEGGESELNNYNNNLTNYINFSPLYRTSKLYKYLAFKENLTDDQIQLAIDKYGFKYPLQLVFNNDFNNDFKWN